MNRHLTTLIPALGLAVQVAPIHAADWPQFRGPNRDGKSPETGLLKMWPDAGPRLVRTISDFGGGFSSPVIAGGRIYITGKVGDDLKIFCFDLSGNKIWERTHAPAFREDDAPHSPYPGARATPTLDGDMIYLLGGLGRLTAYRTSDGEPVWTVDVVGELGGRVPVWGYAESVLIDGDKLIFTPGGEQTGTFAALDKQSGRVLWQSQEVTERAEYASPILIEYNHVRQVVNMTRAGLLAVSPENGALLWRHNRVAGMSTPETTTAHGNSPVYADGYVFEATAYHTRGGWRSEAQADRHRDGSRAGVEQPEVELRAWRLCPRGLNGNSGLLVAGYRDRCAQVFRVPRPYFAQQTPGQGTEPGWKQHVILTPTPDVTTTDFRVSQLHAFDLADMNGDQIPNGLGHIGGHVGIQRQPGLHTRRKEWFGTSVSNSSKGRRPASRSAAISSGKALA